MATPNYSFPNFLISMSNWNGLLNTLAQMLDNLISMDFTGNFEAILANDEVLARIPVARAFKFQEDMPNSEMIAEDAATAETVISLTKNGIEFATATFAIAGTTATFVCTSETSFAIGDILKVVGPATADATLAKLGWHLTALKINV